MQGFIDKLIGRLEEICDINDKLKKEAYENRDWERFGIFTHTNGGIYSTIPIIEELAEQHNNGWINCKDKLPEDDSICLVTLEWPNEETEVTFGWFDRVGICWWVGNYEVRTSNVYAWQPLPPAYKKGGV